MKKHLEGLDEIRGLAALGVLFGHLGVGPKTLAGNMVIVFFTLSGFLISYLLCKEKEKAGSINIKNFYVRRTLRIWPLYFFFIFLVFILTDDIDSNVWYYFLFIGNVSFAFHSYILILSHYWSLAVEEQFYLFWPFLAKRKGSFVKGVVVVFVLFSMVKLYVYLAIGGDSDWYKLIYMTKFQSMCIGALGAYLVMNNVVWIKRLSHRTVEIACLIYILLVVLGRDHLASIIDGEILSAVVVVMLIQQTSADTLLIKLNSSLLRKVGLVSFGIYVYHPLVIKLIEKNEIFLDYNVLYVTVIVILTFSISFGSYYLLERPFLKIKARFSGVTS